MTEKQIKYIYDYHKKYLSIYFGITEQAVFKWGQRGGMPEQYLNALKLIDARIFFDFIEAHMHNILTRKLVSELNAIITIK